jgi:hypothetical protein
MDDWPESEWTMQSIAEDRAYVVLRHMAEGPEDFTFQQCGLHWVAGEYMYMFEYRYLGETDADLEAIFQASIDTAVVKGDHGLPEAFTSPTVWPEDRDAIRLVRNAMTCIESGYVDVKTFDPSVLTPEVLNWFEPAIGFNVLDSPAAATAPTAEASLDTVDYWGDQYSYAVGSVSESGKTFGVIVDKSDSANAVPVFYIDGEVADW